MSMIKDAVTVLHNRLKQLTPEASPEHLAYLAKSIESIGGQGTLLEIVALTDEKLLEVANAVASHQQDLTTAKDNHLTLLDQAKNNHVATLNDVVASQITQIDHLVAVNDVPQGSSILEEISDAVMPFTGEHVANDDLPLLFGIVSRHGDQAWGVGHFTQELGQWHNSRAEDAFKTITGINNWGTTRNGFHYHPSLHFIRGTQGEFIFREYFERYADSGNNYLYPHAALGVLFIKNTTNGDIIRDFEFGGSSYWSSGYEGAGLHLGVPNETDQNKELINTITWSNVYAYSAAVPSFGNQKVPILIPAGKTVALMLYTSAFLNAGNYNRYALFLHWYVFNIRAAFLTAGVEIDAERTIKAWKSSRLAETYEIWR